MKLACKTSEPYPVSIFIAGNYDKAVESCGQYCDEVGLCVTVTPTKYVYTTAKQSPKGMEPGVIVGLINYPRFPTTQDKLLNTAVELATKLLVDLDQQSFTIQSPNFCKWYSRREADLAVDN